MADTKILSDKTVFTSKYFSVKTKVIQRNGKTFSKDFIQKNPITIVIPYTKNNEIYIESQFRDALDRTILELVAGNVEEGEDPFESAKRELLEEAGLIAKTWKKLHVWDLSANLHAKIHVFAATDLEEGQQQLDSDEQVTITKMSLAEVLQKIDDGEMTSASHIAALLLFDRLKREGKL